MSQLVLPQRMLTNIVYFIIFIPEFTKALPQVKNMQVQVPYKLFSNRDENLLAS